MKWISIFWSILLVGCASASNLPLSQDAKESLYGKTFAHVEPKKLESISVIQPDNAIDYSSGSVSATNNGIENPSTALFTNVAKILVEDFGMRHLGKLQNATTVMTASELIRINASKADYILSVSSGHLIVYYPFSWGKYKLAGSAQLKLLGKSGSLISSTHCVFPAKDVAEAPAYDELFVDEAKKLKQLFSEAEIHSQPTKRLVCLCRAVGRFRFGVLAVG